MICEKKREEIRKTIIYFLKRSRRAQRDLASVSESGPFYLQTQSETIPQSFPMAGVRLFHAPYGIFQQGLATSSLLY